MTDRSELIELHNRLSKTLDEERGSSRDKRHDKGYRTARENLEDLADKDSFVEYGQLAIAAQKSRREIEELRTETAADASAGTQLAVWCPVQGSLPPPAIKRPQPGAWRTYDDRRGERTTQAGDDHETDDQTERTANAYDHTTTQTTDDRPDKEEGNC